MIGTVAAAVLSMASLVPLAGEVLVLICVGLGWWLVPGFWRSVLFGAIGGIASGIFVLGVGLRVAMRVVAILNPDSDARIHTGGSDVHPDSIGAIFGGVVGTLANLAKRGLGLRSMITVAILPAAGAMSLLFVDDEIRRELFERGAGPWVNILMFGLVAVLYGITVAVATRVF